MKGSSIHYIHIIYTDNKNIKIQIQHQDSGKMSLNFSIKYVRESLVILSSTAECENVLLAVHILIWETTNVLLSFKLKRLPAGSYTSSSKNTKLKAGVKFSMLFNPLVFRFVCGCTFNAHFTFRSFNFSMMILILFCIIIF